MRVSFVVPTRNQAPFLRRCLDGCLAQGLSDAEVLVLDGLSTDGTQQILASYGDRIRWWSEADTGQAQAVNRGVARATGEVVAWINSDDCYEGPDVLRRVLLEFEDPAVELAYGDALVVDVSGRPIRPYKSRTFASAADLLASPAGPSQPATFFRKALFDRVGGLREELCWALDYDLMIRLFAEARQIARVPGTLAWMTAHPGAKSTAGMLRQILEVAEIKRARAREVPLLARQRARLWVGMAELWAYWAVVKLGLRRAW